MYSVVVAVVVFFVLLGFAEVVVVKVILEPLFVEVLVVVVEVLVVVVEVLVVLVEILVVVALVVITTFVTAAVVVLFGKFVILVGMDVVVFLAVSVKKSSCILSVGGCITVYNL